jgi:hypothetical protein
MLPKLTPLQYLALHLLLVGTQSGDELRRTLRTLGIRQSRAAFSRLMSRLVDANYIDPQPGTRSDNGQTVHFRRYQITDLGLFEWNAAHKFYLNLAPPSSPPTPVSTEQGQLAAYDPQTRNAAIRRKTRGYANRLTSLMVKIAQKSLRQN